MTPSPESRAEKIVHDVFLSGQQWGQHDWKMAESLIAAAIREAENDVLERAIREIRMTAIIADDGETDHAFLNGVAFAGQRLETLKHKD